MSITKPKTEESAMASNTTKLQAAKDLIATLASEQFAEIQQYIVEQKNARRSPLLLLAPELRNRIYYFVSLNALVPHANMFYKPAMLRVSRQVRKEFSGVYFSDLVMTLERMSKSDGVTRWDKVAAGQAMLSALLSVQSGFQSDAFKQLFRDQMGGCYSTPVYQSQWVSPRKHENTVELRKRARAMAESYSVAGKYYALTGILVFEAASKVTSRMVYQRTYDNRLKEREAETELKRKD